MGRHHLKRRVVMSKWQDVDPMILKVSPDFLLGLMVYLRNQFQRVSRCPQAVAKEGSHIVLYNCPLLCPQSDIQAKDGFLECLGTKWSNVLLLPLSWKKIVLLGHPILQGELLSSEHAQCFSPENIFQNQDSWAPIDRVSEFYNARTVWPGMVTMSPWRKCCSCSSTHTALVNILEQSRSNV